jgi:hypothetical protein
MDSSLIPYGVNGQLRHEGPRMEWAHRLEAWVRHEGAQSHVVRIHPL